MCLANLFYDFFLQISESYTSLIDILIRVTRTSLACCDHTYVNFLENFFTDVLQTSFSDHAATFCCVPIWMGRISNVSKYLFQNNSEENIRSLRKIFQISSMDELISNEKIHHFELCNIEKNIIQKFSSGNKNFGNSESN